MIHKDEKEKHIHSQKHSSNARCKKGTPLFLWSFVVLVGFWSLIISPSAEAFFYHATRRAVAKRIMTRGINPAKLRSKARFGKGLYLSRRISTALAEKGKRNAVIRMKSSRYLKGNILNFRNPTKRKIRSFLKHKIDFRGKLKKWIIGPKLGRKLGRAAGRKGKVIQYRSVKTGGTNLVIPKRLLKKRPRIVRPEKLVR